MTIDRTQLNLDRLRAKHARYAEETNRLLTEQVREIARLRAALAEVGGGNHDSEGAVR